MRVQVQNGLFLLCMFVAAALAQFDQGQISGTVTDNSRALLPGAKVIAVNIQTGASHSTEAGTNGSYIITNLPVGDYTVTAEASGFKKFIRNDVKVDAATRVTVDVTLELGLVTESITVVGLLAELQQETAQIGRVVESRQISDLALNGRNPVAVILLKAGVTGGNFNSFSSDSMSSGMVNINGGSATDNAVTVDGVNVTRTRSGCFYIGVFNADTIQEVQILTSSYPAEYGRSKDGQVRFVTKSGTRDLHGTAYEFFRNSALDANTWVRNSSPKPEESSHAAPFRFNQPGYTVGGPVVIPGKFNTGKTKLFFFGGQEWIRFRQESTATGTVPSLLMRQGNFSELLDAKNPFFGRVRVVNDPSAGAPFANNIIPQSRLSHNGIGLLNAWPKPTPGFQLGTANWIQSRPGPRNSRKDFIRLDYYAGIHRITFSANNYSYWESQGFYNGMDIAPTLLDRPNRFGTIGVTSTINPHLINEGSFSAAADRSRFTLHETDGQRLWERDRYGIDFPFIFPAADKIVPNRIPETTSIAGLLTLQGNNRPAFSSGPMFTWADNLTWINSSTHTLKFGVNFAAEQANNGDQTNAQTGIVTFLDTGNPLSTGLAIANAALGNYDTYNETGKAQYTLSRSKALEAFAQDTWKATPNLTFEYGVRFAYYQPWYAVWNDLANFSLDYYDRKNLPVVDPVGGFIISGNPYNGIVLPGDGYPASAAGRAYGVTDPLSKNLFHGLPRALVYGTNYGFAPRFGVAYKIANKTVIRVGGGVFRNRQLTDANTLIKMPPNTNQANVLNGRMDNPGGGVNRNYLFTLRVQDWDYKIPTAISYSFSVQRQLPGSMLLDVSYVGKTADHLPRSVNINQLQAGTLQANRGINAGFLRPYFGLGDFSYKQFAARSTYNSLQVSLDRRFRSGLGFGMAYTFSKSIDDTANPYNAYNIRVSSKGISSFDRTHVLNLNYIYQLPIFRNPSNFTGRMLSGWQISGVTFLRSGSPFSVTDSTDTAGIGPGGGTQRWNLVGNTGVTGDRGLNKLWFNTTAFALPAAGTFGNSGLDILRGPAFRSWDLALFKNFRFVERLTTELRWEVFNFLNHPVLDNPGTNPRAGSFGLVTGKSGERNMQLGLKFIF